MRDSGECVECVRVNTGKRASASIVVSTIVGVLINVDITAHIFAPSHVLMISCRFGCLVMNPLLSPFYGNYSCIG